MLLPLLLHAATAPGAIPRCRADQIGLRLGGDPGDFNGMSHSGTLVILRNRGRAVCRLSATPHITMLDGAGRTLPVESNPASASSPPLALRPAAVVSTPLRWVSGAVFDRSRCVTPVRLVVSIAGRLVSTAFQAHLCGPGGKAVRFDQPALRPGLRTSA